MLTLRGVDYGNIFCAPGALGFFGEGYPYHSYAKLLGMTFEGTGFVSKTIVFPPREGNMPFKADRLTPKESFVPRSIVVKPISGHVLNAVGLSGPGLKWALSQHKWQDRSDAFMISFMSVAATRQDRLDETQAFVAMMKLALPDFRGKVAIQFNRACPNTGHLADEFFAETDEQLEALAELGLAIVVNYNPLVPLEVMMSTAANPNCDALWIGNTIPWGETGVDWFKLFGTEESPLAGRNLPVPGNGGLSGPACFAHTVERVIEARSSGITKPIVAGNGIRNSGDAARLRFLGADAVAIGTLAMVRPWRMRQVIKSANMYNGSV